MYESRMLYRYISFEQLVDLQQRQALTLVLPEVWEDPTEKQIFNSIISKVDHPYAKAQLEIYKGQTFCQSWTTLDESDAMWRIYSSNNKSIRIQANEYDLLDLDNELVAKDVEYSNKTIDLPRIPDSEIDDYIDIIAQSVLDSLTRKRTAFSHEKEVRLICALKIEGTEWGMIDYYIAYFAQCGDLSTVSELCKHNHRIDPSNKLQICQLLNKDDARKTTKEISFAKNPGLIRGVMVHPLAPDWYVETVKTFCDRHSIPFDGKSKLYS